VRSPAVGDERRIAHFDLDAVLALGRRRYGGAALAGDQPVHVETFFLDHRPVHEAPVAWSSR